jgi:hypothetical protein
MMRNLHVAEAGATVGPGDVPSLSRSFAAWHPGVAPKSFTQTLNDSCGTSVPSVDAAAKNLLHTDDGALV